MKKNGTNKVFTSAAILVLFISQALASTVDSVLTYSPSMKKNIRAVVIKPDTYSSGKSYPIVYLLHGAWGDCTDWIKRAPIIAKYSDMFDMLIVCPDALVSSWYFDSPEDPAFKYETYISSELIQWIDEHYKTIKSPLGRAITGLSMGGHGALFLAFKHQDIFGAAGSMSGGVDLRPFSTSWDIPKRLGKYEDHPERWEQNSVINLTYLLKPNSLAIIFDCGTSDFFKAVNDELHNKLLYMNIPHDYISRPGGHSWNYWANAVQYQLTFMHTFFVNASSTKKNQ